MKKIKHFIWSEHFKKRLEQRGIKSGDCEMAILEPDKKEMQHKGAYGGIVWVFYKEFDYGKLKVAAEIKDDTARIATTFIVDA